MTAGSAVAGFLAGVFGAMGLGGGTVLILYLTLICGTEQLAAQGINLLFFLPIAAVAVLCYAYRKKIDLKQIVPILAGGMAGTFLGVLAAKSFGNGLTAKIFGGSLILCGLREIFAKPQEKCLKPRKKNGILKKDTE